MKKMSGTLLVFVLATLMVQAQKHEPVNPVKDQMQFMGYSVRLYSGMGGTYGYDIIKSNQVLLHQVRNPFTGSRIGLREKADVYKVAKWQIENMKQRTTVQGMQPAQSKTHFAKLPPAWRKRLEKMHNQQPVIIPKVNRKVAEQLHINLGNH